MPRTRPHEFWCSGCEKIRTKDDFLYRGNGKRRPYCNDCRKSQAKSYWHERGGKENKQRYRKTEKGKSVTKKIKENKIANDPLFRVKVKARAKVYNEIRSRRLPKATDCICTDCGRNANEYDHHLGYDRKNWLNVEPVCWFCHSKRTRKNAPSIR
jgi:hypothetical protein